MPRHFIPGLLALAALSAPALAHHGWGSYDAQNPMTLTAVIAFLLIRGYGERLVAPPPEAAAVYQLGAPGGGGEAIGFFLLLGGGAKINQGSQLELCKTV